MAGVTFDGHLTKDLEIGGISGKTEEANFRVTVKNCANYGTITHEEHSIVERSAYIGGAIGTSNGNILNCANYGVLVHSGEARSLYMGGITAEAYHITIENCANFGNLESGSNSTYFIGAIAGEVVYSNGVYYSYWDKNTCENGLGPGYLYDAKYVISFDNEFALTREVSIGKYVGVSLIDALNAYTGYHVLDGYSTWALNKDAKDISFTINSKKEFTLNPRLILLPSLAAEGMKWFNGWYMDSECTIPLASSGNITVTELYGKFEKNDKEFTITFADPDEANETYFTGAFGTVVEFPPSTKGKYSVAFWSTDAGEKIPWNLTMPAFDMTLSPTWVLSHITSARDLIEFSNRVNSGEYDYTDVTVVLDNDIEFTDELSGLFVPIGWENLYGEATYFNGIFDGQGFAIKGLKIQGYKYFGLFGYSLGVTIKNVVMDSSCTYVGVQYGTSTIEYIGSIIGYCESTMGPCIIDNCVNNMDTTYTVTTNSVYLGGIAGDIFGYFGHSSEHYSRIINSVNNGNLKVKSDGKSESIVMGGIVATATLIQIDRCTNSGNIIFEGKTNASLIMEAFVYNAYGTSVTNCENYGKIIKKKQHSGSVTGYVFIGIDVVIVVAAMIFGIYELIQRRKRRNNRDAEYMSIN